MDKIKIWIRDFLRGLADNFDPDRKKSGPVVRNTKEFLKTEVKIPIVLSVVITFFIVYFMLLTQIGYAYFNALAAGLVTLVMAYIFIGETRKEADLVSDNDAVVLMCLMLVIAILIMQVTQYYLSILAFPIGAFVVMAALLLRPRIGLAFAIVLSVLGGMLNNMSFETFVILFAGAMAVLAPARTIRSRGGFLAVTLVQCVIAISLVSMFYLLLRYDFTQYQQNIYFVLLGGVFMMIALLVLMPIFEKVFSRTTSVKLIELGDFNNPLLKALMVKAPGTYHHCIMTALIAEQAARAINADPVLARVASYYHDIGKINNPEYFIENQNKAENPHDNLPTAMSLLILNSHIKDGVALAKKYNMDKDIIDNIEQHHGTTIMSYFYNKSCHQLGEENLNENDFRYPGPKPQTKIAAIIMIADSCEAACRSIDDPTDVEISEMVDKVVDAKMDDDQFSEAPITFKELEEIKDSVKKSVIAQNHSRIKYEQDSEDAKENSHM
ncbi:MAG: HDIG domain-containing protein [Elusimicrobiota bacterium]|jgi:putative nucleotidyltransferase with HDIG domain|nr:HDIG domain-containing protein [Elusimicrobiota bacterium]